MVLVVIVVVLVVYVYFVVLVRANKLTNCMYYAFTFYLYVPQNRRKCAFFKVF